SRFVSNLASAPSSWLPQAPPYHPPYLLCIARQPSGDDLPRRTGLRRLCGRLLRSAICSCQGQRDSRRHPFPVVHVQWHSHGRIRGCHHRWPAPHGRRLAHCPRRRVLGSVQLPGAPMREASRIGPRLLIVPLRESHGDLLHRALRAGWHAQDGGQHGRVRRWLPDDPHLLRHHALDRGGHPWQKGRGEGARERREGAGPVPRLAGTEVRQRGPGPEGRAPQEQDRRLSAVQRSHRHLLRREGHAPPVGGRLLGARRAARGAADPGGGGPRGRRPAPGRGRQGHRGDAPAARAQERERRRRADPHVGGGGALVREVPRVDDAAPEGPADDHEEPVQRGLAEVAVPPAARRHLPGHLRRRPLRHPGRARGPARPEVPRSARHRCGVPAVRGDLGRVERHLPRLLHVCRLAGVGGAQLGDPACVLQRLHLDCGLCVPHAGGEAAWLLHLLHDRRRVFSCFCHRHRGTPLRVRFQGDPGHQVPAALRVRLRAAGHGRVPHRLLRQRGRVSGRRHRPARARSGPAGSPFTLGCLAALTLGSAALLVPPRCLVCPALGVRAASARRRVVPCPPIFLSPSPLVAVSPLCGRSSSAHRAHLRFHVTQPLLRPPRASAESEA
ncbi:unnamed protein product, partial [Prorocentrum cordatum]